MINHHIDHHHYPLQSLFTVIFATACLVWTGCEATGPATQRVEVEVVPGPASLEQAQAVLDDRPAWTDLPPLMVPRHPAQKYLAGWAIVIDPGHGGHADRVGYKRGPAGVREAEINWRVSVLLRQLLADAGAQVVLTRAGDEAISLQDRAKIANELVRDRDGVVGADLFLSVHHNLSPKATTNWTSVWFHDDPNHSEVGIDAGRYIAHRVGEALRTQVGVTSPLMTDRQMYDGGFGVIRAAEVPALLAELSFYSHPEEEQRLRDGLYNLRCAYAIYLGLVEYAYGGRPTQESIEVVDSDTGSQLRVVLDDGMPEGWWGGDRTRILRDGIAVTLDGQDVPLTFDPATRQLEAILPRELLEDEASGERSADGHILKLRHENFFKHANWPQRYRLMRHDTEGWQLTPLPARRLESDAKPGGS